MSTGDQGGESQPVEHQPDERELLREEIEQVRADLGETVEALAGKADVKGQVHDKVQDTKAQVHDKVADTKTQVQQKVEGVKAQLGGGDRPVPATMRDRLAGPVLPGAVAAVCALLLVRALARGRR